MAQREAGEISFESEMLYMICLLLADSEGVLTREDTEVWAPWLLDQGFVKIQPFERDPDYVRVRYRFHRSPGERADCADLHGGS